jgi:Na+/H+ antiporter NhaD/arsenite permease-like protein
MTGNVFRNIFRFYIDGFKSMTYGKTLWIIILIKLFIIFAVLKLFFFPDFLKKNFPSDDERSNYVIDQLTKP